LGRTSIQKRSEGTSLRGMQQVHRLFLCDHDAPPTPWEGSPPIPMGRQILIHRQEGPEFGTTIPEQEKARGDLKSPGRRPTTAA
jgi:hypothetical protein